MKKLKLFLFLFISLFIFNLDVDASTYIRGIVKSSSTVKKIDGSKLLNDTGGSIVLYSPEAVEITGESGSQYKIKFIYSGFFYEGYVPKANVISKTYTVDDKYQDDLVRLGFPKDYASKLAILHAIHPNWTFTPSYTGGVIGGMDFYTAVNGEASVVARNLIQSNNTSLRSTEDGAYKNGQWISLSGSNWYAASRQTIAFYMDPRNFLNESNVFMFENGGYNPNTQTQDQVNKILDGTFMTNPFQCFETSTDCPIGEHAYIDSFMQGAKDKLVNPIHMASRVRQEQGTNGSTLSLGKGYKEQYIGYYNFFNIGASGTTTEQVIMNGLAYAKGKNWDNQHKSIYDGIAFIGRNYISRGQSTKYYEKFNTIAKSYYGNQYMQNVRAPYSEGYSTYKGYYNSFEKMEDWDVAKYDFLIPVYQNMGDSTSLDESFNSDSTLKSLKVEGCSLNPDFQSSAYNYECYVQDTVNEISVSAETTNANAKVSYPSKVSLPSTKTDINVVVTAINGSTSTYKITVNKIKTDGYTPLEVLNGIGIKVSDNFISNIELGMDVSNLINSVAGKYYFAKVKVTELNGTVVMEGPLKTGQTVTVENAGKTSTYKVVIYGDVSGDGLIDIRDLLATQKHLVKAKTLTDEYFKASDINKDNVIDIRDLLLIRKYLCGVY